MKPSGEICKCGATKPATEFFCASCSEKLPRPLLVDLSRTDSWDGFRALIRRAVIILDLPQTRNAQQKKQYAPA
jgi:hypothetical protein